MKNGADLMAEEYALKILVNGIENTAGDFERLGQLLNLRSQLYRVKKEFTPTQYQPPKPRYPSKEESVAQAAASAAVIADIYALAAKYFHVETTSPPPLDPHEYGEEGLIHLIVSWQGLRATVLKAILGVYGEFASSAPRVSLPGPASEQRLWAEVAAWLKKIAADASLFTIAQKLSSARKSPLQVTRAAPILESLVLLEQSFHRATLDALLIAGALPYHLYRTAQRSMPKVKASS
jgi:hypothetical protein